MKYRNIERTPQPSSSEQDKRKEIDLDSHLDCAHNFIVFGFIVVVLYHWPDLTFEYSTINVILLIMWAYTNT